MCDDTVRQALHWRGRGQVRNDDPCAGFGGREAHARGKAAGGAGAVPGPGGDHGASRLVQQRGRERAPRLRRVGLSEHHVEQGRRHRGALRRGVSRTFAGNRARRPLPLRLFGTLTGGVGSIRELARANRSSAYSGR